MKLMKVFSVYDSKAELFGKPFTALNEGTAVRSFQSAVMEEDHEFQKYSEDFTLFELGTFDQENGHMVSHPTPRSIVQAMVLLNAVGRDVAVGDQDRIRE